MVKMSPYGLAVAVVASTFVAIGAGAAVTSSPELGSFRQFHLILAAVAGLLTVILGVRLWPVHRQLAAALIGFVLLLTIPLGESASFRIVHACLAQGLFCSTWVAAVLTSRRWAEGPSIVHDGGVPSLRSMARVAVAVTALQVVLGAGFRHGTLTVVPHVVGAILTTVMLLVLATFVITQFPNHRPLMRAAWHVIAIVAVQIGLGVIAFIGRLNHPEGAVPSGALVASTVAHVSFGALTLGSTIALALQVQYHVRRRVAHASGLPVAL